MQSFHNPAQAHDEVTSPTSDPSTLDLMASKGRSPKPAKIGNPPAPPPPKPKVFLRKKEVMRRTGLARSTIDWMVLGGRFPPPVKIGDWAIAWPESEITEWQEARIAERDAKASESS